jgi:hypothetical protein
VGTIIKLQAHSVPFTNVSGNREMNVVWAKKRCFVAIPGLNIVILVGEGI